MSAALRAWHAVSLPVLDRLALLRLRLQRRLRFRAEATKRMDRLDAKFDAVLAMMRATLSEDSTGDWPPRYQAAADIQARRREIHLVRTGGGQ